MRTIKLTLGVIAAGALLWSVAAAADKPESGVTVVYKDGTTAELKSIEFGTKESGLFGSSFKTLKALPVKTKRFQLEVPVEKLAKIEVLAAKKPDKKGEHLDVTVRLTAVDPKTKPIEGVIEAKKKVTWKGVHPFADSRATLDPAAIKEIVLRPTRK